MTNSASPHPTSSTPQKSGLGMGCKILLGIGLFSLALVIIAVIMVVNTVNWVKNAPQAQPAVYSNAPLNPQQKGELFKIHMDHRAAYAAKKDLEISFTTELANAWIAEEIRKNKKGGQPNEAEGADVRFDGDKTVIRFTVKQPDGKFLNFEVRGEPSFENGVFKGNVEQIKMAGQEPPLLARMWLNAFVDAAKRGEFKDPDKPNAKSPFEALKLVRREGDRIRVIIDGNHVPDPDKDKDKDGGKDGGTEAPIPEL